VPPFRGGTWQAFYARSDNCQPVLERGNAANRLSKSHCAALVTEHVDALARSLAPESRHIVAFNLSGTTSRAVVFDPLVATVLRKRSGALSALGEG
jgi:hypothetical protein